MFLEEKGTFFKEQCTFFGKRPKFPKETCVSNIFAIIIIFCSFLCELATYHWKGCKESYNFIVGNIPIKIHMQKL
jgi:hypothetical protein